MYNKNDNIVERLLDEVDEKYLSDEDIAEQYDDFSCTYLKLEKGHPSVENWYNFTLELEFPEADHPDFSDYVVENGYYNKDDDVWGFYNWYPEETKNKIKAIILKEIDDMEAQGLTELETDMQSKQLELNFENNDIAESLINEDDATGHVDIKALDTNKFGEVENLEFELVHDGEIYYVECYAPDLANEDYYVIRVYKTEGQQLNNETEVAKGYTDSTGGVFDGDELEFYDYEKDYSELTQKIMDVILANLKEVVSHEQLESKMNEISDKIVSDVTGRRASDYIWTKMHPDENSPEDTERVRKKLARNLDLVNKRNARKDKENNMQNDDIAEGLLYEISDDTVDGLIDKRRQKLTNYGRDGRMSNREQANYESDLNKLRGAQNKAINRAFRKHANTTLKNDDIAESLLNEVSDELKQRVIDKRKENVKNAQDKLNRATRLAKQIQPITITITAPMVDVYEDSYEEGELGYVNNWEGSNVTKLVRSYEDVRDLLADACDLSLDAEEVYIGSFNINGVDDLQASIFVNNENTTPSEDEIASWKKGELKLYNAIISAIVKFENPEDREVFINILENSGNDVDIFEESKKSDSSLNKITEEDLNDLLSMSGERYTNIADLDMPAPLADSVPTTEDGEPITIELLYKAITDLTATIGNLATSIKQPKVELKPLENPMGQPAPKSEPALTDDLIGELDDVADDVADNEQKVADDEKDIKDKESEIEDDAEDLDELDKEIEADLDDTEKADKKKKDKKSDKDEDDKKKKNEDLETAKKEIDKAIADKKSPEEIDATIDYTTDNDTDEKAANEYKVQKMKEACKASVKNSLLNKLKWGN